MYKVVNNEIFITRGDSAILSLTIDKPDGTPYTLQEGDVLDFTVKASTEATKVLLHKND